MIDVNSLRIGNLIDKNKDSHTPDIKNGVHVYLPMIVTGGLISELSLNDNLKSHYSPIPLSEEWLKKGGCKDKEDFADGIGRYTWWENIDYGYSITKVADSLYSIQDCQCHPFKYLHQWQNIHYLITGEELKIIDK